VWILRLARKPLVHKVCLGTPSAFADYARVVTDRLGDRIEHWTTSNEPWCVADPRSWFRMKFISRESYS
jgi:beta-glucosidase/6-phospho-beta-glucosidase/beta-galactosidase